MCSDPGRYAVVFVFLVSKTGSSVGIWRRMVHVPPSLQARYDPQISQVKRELAAKGALVTKIEYVSGILYSHRPLTMINVDHHRWFGPHWRPRPTSGGRSASGGNSGSRTSPLDPTPLPSRRTSRPRVGGSNSPNDDNGSSVTYSDGFLPLYNLFSLHTHHAHLITYDFLYLPPFCCLVHTSFATCSRFNVIGSLVDRASFSQTFRRRSRAVQVHVCL